MLVLENPLTATIQQENEDSEELKEMKRKVEDNMLIAPYSIRYGMLYYKDVLIMLEIKELRN